MRPTVTIALGRLTDLACRVFGHHPHSWYSNVVCLRCQRVYVVGQGWRLPDA